MAKTDLTLRLEKGAPLTHSEQDTNFNRLGYHNGFWQAGTSQPNEIVFHNGGLWRCVNETTAEPDFTSVDWWLLTPQPGLASLELSTPDAGFTLGAGWSTIPFDTENHTPYGLTPNTANNDFVFDFVGTWEMNVFFNVSFTDSNSGRETRVRIFDVTGATGGTGTAVYIGRNQDGVSFNIAVRANVAAAAVGNTFRFEMGGGDSLSGVTLQQAVIDFRQVSPRVYV